MLCANLFKLRSPAQRREPILVNPFIFYSFAFMFCFLFSVSSKYQIHVYIYFLLLDFTYSMYIQCFFFFNQKTYICIMDRLCTKSPDLRICLYRHTARMTPINEKSDDLTIFCYLFMTLFSKTSFNIIYFWCISKIRVSKSI